MKIAIIGTGNVGGALATKWAHAGHEIFLGVRDVSNFKGTDLLQNPTTSLHTIQEAVALSEVVLMATPAITAIETTKSLGDTMGKVIIDAANIVNGRGPRGFESVTEAIIAYTATDDVVKCFNTTGYNNMKDPAYGDQKLDMFVAGDSPHGKLVAIDLAHDAGFGACYDIGGNDKFDLMEQFARFWINLALNQGHGRDIGFKVLKR
ncbi:NADPH-dependent F420 reductase [Lunatibacter salilacus]|uniref:NADPH-dependent F420 reductase n=1 Tax=Lunatibacter salilacus TaxID=2483804 RepID=UPI00131CFD71|nr:NAD(P)-binding domain-containing protein [Lunatibacter salilacus]